MKVFISWSGDKSKAVAGIVKWWLGIVHPAAKPWFSTVDIQAGDRWASEIEKGLDGASFGIICVTPQNVDSRWINYEAGAISKQVDGTKTKVTALLIDYGSPTELEMPLSQFNAVMPTKEGFQDLALSINSALDDSDRREAASIRDLVDLVWEKLNQKLNEIAVSEPDRTPRKRGDSDLLEEVLLRVRGLDARIDEIAWNTHREVSRLEDMLGRTTPRKRTSVERDDSTIEVARDIIRGNVPEGMNPRRVQVDMLNDKSIRVGTPRPLTEDEQMQIMDAVRMILPVRTLNFFVHGLNHIGDERYGLE